MHIVLKDVWGFEVFLQEKVWEDHIIKNHNEINIETIAQVLIEPSLICESQHSNMKNYLQYYFGPWKNTFKKERFYRVVLKKCQDGNWISTAHIRSKISCGKIVYIR